MSKFNTMSTALNSVFL